MARCGVGVGLDGLPDVLRDPPAQIAASSFRAEWCSRERSCAGKTALAALLAVGDAWAADREAASAAVVAETRASARKASKPPPPDSAEMIIRAATALVRGTSSRMAVLRGWVVVLVTLDRACDEWSRFDRTGELRQDRSNATPLPEAKRVGKRAVEHGQQRR